MNLSLVSMNKGKIKIHNKTFIKYIRKTKD